MHMHSRHTWRVSHIKRGRVSILCTWSFLSALVHLRNVSMLYVKEIIFMPELMFKSWSQRKVLNSWELSTVLLEINFAWDLEIYGWNFHQVDPWWPHDKTSGVGKLCICVLLLYLEPLWKITVTTKFSWWLFNKQKAMHERFLSMYCIWLLSK